MEENNSKTKVFYFAVAIVLLASLAVGCGETVNHPKDNGTVTGVTLNKSELKLEEGKTATLTATVSPANATNKKVTWSSDKPEVAAVDQNGTVTAKKAGTAKIIATTEDGNKTAECTVMIPPQAKYQITFAVDGGYGTLKAKADGTVETEASPITVEKGKTVTFTFTAIPDSNYEVEKWTKNDAPVSEAGMLLTYSCTVAADTDIKVTFKPSDKSYTAAGTVSFTMKGIAAVTNKYLGTNEGGIYENNPMHKVDLSAYLIGETEVTQELWKAVMDNDPSDFNGGHGKEAADGEVQKKRPVENVNRYHAIAFCNKLSKACGLEPCYTVSGVDFDVLNFNDIPISNNDNWNNAVCNRNKNGFRLPTEAEWEWAAMGGKRDKWAGTNAKSTLKDYAWYINNDGGNANSKTHQVKMKLPNGYGLYDMSGNVWEWCWDWDSNLSGTLPPDYEGASSGTYRVLRGGSWLNNADDAACAFRDDSASEYRQNNLGLRVVCRP